MLLSPVTVYFNGLNGTATDVVAPWVEEFKDVPAGTDVCVMTDPDRGRGLYARNVGPDFNQLWRVVLDYDLFCTAVEHGSTVQVIFRNTTVNTVTTTLYRNGQLTPSHTLDTSPYPVWVTIIPDAVPFPPASQILAQILDPAQVAAGATNFVTTAVGPAMVLSGTTNLSALTGSMRQAQILSYYGDNQGGAITLTPDFSDTTSPDNGGTVRVVNGVRWKAPNDVRLSARLFGCRLDGSDDTLGLQAALDFAFQLGGADVYLDRGTCSISNVHMQSGVSLVGDAGAAFRAKNSVLKQLPTASGPLVTMLAGETRCAVKGVLFMGLTTGVSFTGTGPAPAVSQGVSMLSSYSSVDNCRFDGFNDQAVQMGPTTVGNAVLNSEGTRCLLNRYRGSVKSGALEFNGTDYYGLNSQFGCGYDTLPTPFPAPVDSTDTTNTMIAGVGVLGANGFLVNVHGEKADTGIRLSGGAGFNRLVNSRGDLNSGHGVIVENSYNKITNLLCQNNSQSAHNSYDGIMLSVGAVNNTYDITTRDINSNKIRYGANDFQAGTQANQRNKCRAVNGMGYGTALYNATQAFGSSPWAPMHRVQPADGTTSIDTTDTRYIDFSAYTVATTITAFTGGYPGKELAIFGSMLVTVANNSTIKTSSGQNKVLEPRFYFFTMQNGVWYESAGESSKTVQTVQNPPSGSTVAINDGPENTLVVISSPTSLASLTLNLPADSTTNVGKRIEVVCNQAVAAIAFANAVVSNPVSTLALGQKITMVKNGALSWSCEGWMQVSQTVSNPSSGSTVNLMAGPENVVVAISPAAPLAALTLNLPADTLTQIGKRIDVVSTQPIAALTVTGATTVTTPASSLVIGQRISLLKIASNTWAGDGLVRVVQTVNNPLTGGTVNLPAGPEDALVVLNPAGTLATLTLNLPADGLTSTGKRIDIVSTQAIGALTVGGATTVSGTPTGLAIGQRISLVKTGSNTWAGDGVVAKIVQTITNPLSGSTQTLPAGVEDSLVVLNPSATLATLTVNLPADASVQVGKKIELVSTQSITALTLGGATTILNPASTLVAGQKLVLTKNASNSWTCDGALRIMQSTAALSSGATVNLPGGGEDVLMVLNSAALLAALTLNLPADTTVPVGKRIELVSAQGVTSLSITGATTINNPPSTLLLGQKLTLIKTGANTWSADGWIQVVQTVSNPTSGAVVNLQGGPENVVAAINPSGPLAALTLNLTDTTSTIGKKIEVICSQPVTALTITGATTITTPASTLNAGQKIVLTKNGTGSWSCDGLQKIVQTITNPSSGSTLNIPPGIEDVVIAINASATIAALTLTLPTDTAVPVGKRIEVVTNQAVTALTISGATTINNAASALNLGQKITLTKVAANTWFCDGLQKIVQTIVATAGQVIPIPAGPEDVVLVIAPAGTLASLTCTFGTDATMPLGKRVTFYTTQPLTALTVNGATTITNALSALIGAGAKFELVKMGPSRWG